MSSHPSYMSPHSPSHLSSHTPTIQNFLLSKKIYGTELINEILTTTPTKLNFYFNETLSEIYIKIFKKLISQFHSLHIFINYNSNYSKNIVECTLCYPLMATLHNETNLSLKHVENIIKEELYRLIDSCLSDIDSSNCVSDSSLNCSLSSKVSTGAVSDSLSDISGGYIKTFSSATHSPPLSPGLSGSVALSPADESGIESSPSRSSFSLADKASLSPISASADIRDMENLSTLSQSNIKQNTTTLTNKITNKNNNKIENKNNIKTFLTNILQLHQTEYKTLLIKTTILSKLTRLNKAFEYQFIDLEAEWSKKFNIIKDILFCLFNIEKVYLCVNDKNVSLSELVYNNKNSENILCPANIFNNKYDNIIKLTIAIFKSNKENDFIKELNCIINKNLHVCIECINACMHNCIIYVNNNKNKYISFENINSIFNRDSDLNVSLTNKESMEINKIEPKYDYKIIKKNYNINNIRKYETINLLFSYVRSINNTLDLNDLYNNIINILKNIDWSIKEFMELYVKFSSIYLDYLLVNLVELRDLNEITNFYINSNNSEVVDDCNITCNSKNIKDEDGVYNLLFKYNEVKVCRFSFLCLCGEFVGFNNKVIGDLKSGSCVFYMNDTLSDSGLAGIDCPPNSPSSMAALARSDEPSICGNKTDKDYIPTRSSPSADKKSSSLISASAHTREADDLSASVAADINSSVESFAINRDDILSPSLLLPDNSGNNKEDSVALSISDKSGIKTPNLLSFDNAPDNKNRFINFYTKFNNIPEIYKLLSNTKEKKTNPLSLNLKFRPSQNYLLNLNEEKLYLFKKEISQTTLITYLIMRLIYFFYNNINYNINTNYSMKFYLLNNTNKEKYIKVYNNIKSSKYFITLDYLNPISLNDINNTNGRNNTNNINLDKIKELKQLNEVTLSDLITKEAYFKYTENNSINKNNGINKNNSINKSNGINKNNSINDFSYFKSLFLISQYSYLKINILNYNITLTFYQYNLLKEIINNFSIINNNKISSNSIKYDKRLFGLKDTLLTFIKNRAFLILSNNSEKCKTLDIRFIEGEVKDGIYLFVNNLKKVKKINLNILDKDLVEMAISKGVGKIDGEFLVYIP
ncbi:hypothetical protein CDIK_0365 [Cucumispora dikerogammari]|nr:hypothetical protein CDIK_0365 [Cucumispora dikerogammari]